MTTTRALGALRILLGLSVGLAGAALVAEAAAAPPVAAPKARSGKPALVAAPTDERAPAAAQTGKPPPGAAPRGPAVVTAPLTPAQKAAIDEGIRLNREAGALEEKKKYAEALVIAERSLALQESALGPGHPSLSATEGFVATLLERTGRHDRARTLRERVLAARERSSGPESLDVAYRLWELARDCSEVGDHAREIQLYERAGRIFAKSSPARLEVAESALFVSRAQFAQGDLPAAEATLHKTLGMWEAQERPYPNLVGDTYITLGQVYVAARREREALDAFEKAVALHRHGIALNGLARAAMALGELHLRRGALTQARQAYAEAGRSEHADLEHAALAEVAAARIDAELGDYPRAEAVFRQVIEAGPARMGVALPRAELGLGELFARHGDAASAEPLLIAGLAALERALGPEHIEVAEALEALAEVTRLQGDLRGAEARLVKARGIVEARRGPEDPLIASIEASLARIALARGDIASAERRLTLCLALREKALGPSHPAVAGALRALGDLALLRGDAAGAATRYGRALSVAEASLGRDHLEVAAARAGLAAAALARGDVAAAVAEEARALDVEEHNLGLVLSLGSEAQKQRFMTALDASTAFAVALHAAARSGDPAAARLALTAILQRKGRVLDVMADALVTVRRRLPKEDQALLAQIASARAAFAAAALRGGGDAPLEARRDEITRLSAEVTRLEAKSSALSAALVEQEAPSTIERVQAALPEDAVLIELFFYRPGSGGAGAAGEPRLAAYTLEPSGRIRSADLGPAAPIEAAAARLRKVLASPAEAGFREPARALDELTMRKLRPLLGSAKRVLISPDGALNLVPFDALIDEEGRFLMERLELTYLTSGRDLLRNLRGSASPSAPLVIANPAFGRERFVGGRSAPEPARRRSISLSGVVFPPLPGTASEARALAKLLTDAEVMVDVEATESNLKKASAPRILHVATHGFFLPDAPRGAGEAEAHALPERGDPSAPEATRSLAVAENPLLRSGLALAGANGLKSGDEDGILTALEASGLDLEGTELVVLSACETGLGDVKNGDGVYGLRRALLIAGAATAVTSLWKVDDQATRDLMTSYYGKLLRGGGRSAALHEVQRAMAARKQTAHPYYWASFTVAGEASPLRGRPREPEAPKVPPGARGCACATRAVREDSADPAIALLVLAAGIARRLRRAIPAARASITSGRRPCG